MEEIYTISFDQVSVAEGNKLANELQSYLKTISYLDSTISPAHPNTQDAGSIITIILSSASIASMAKGLSDWLLKKQSRKLTIKKNGDIIGENLSSGDIKTILNYSKQ